MKQEPVCHCGNYEKDHIPYSGHEFTPTTQHEEQEHRMTTDKQELPEFKIGDAVRKKGDKGQWHGFIVGTYSTKCTPNGYAVESVYEENSVQIYPASALEPWSRPAKAVQGDKATLSDLPIFDDIKEILRLEDAAMGKHTSSDECHALFTAWRRLDFPETLRFFRAALTPESEGIAGTKGSDDYHKLCAQCWDALGVKEYTGKHIADHIRELVALARAQEIDVEAIRKLRGTVYTLCSDSTGGLNEIACYALDQCDDLIRSASGYLSAPDGKAQKGGKLCK